MAPNAVFALALVCGTFITLAILGMFALRRRNTAPKNPRFESDVVDRLNRIEQAVETIALEVERVSESQRFVTKIMAERGAPQLSARVADQDRPNG